MCKRGDYCLLDEKKKMWQTKTLKSSIDVEVESVVDDG